jgi:hypothetical protein
LELFVLVVLLLAVSDLISVHVRCHITKGSAGMVRVLISYAGICLLMLLLLLLLLLLQMVSLEAEVAAKQAQLSALSEENAALNAKARALDQLLASAGEAGLLALLLLLVLTRQLPFLVQSAAGLAVAAVTAAFDWWH